MFQCFETPDMGPGIFTFFLFQFVSKRFETIECVDLEIICLFHFVSVVLLYILYVSMFRKHQIWGLEFSPFLFQFVRNVLKQFKVWT